MAGRFEHVPLAFPLALYLLLPTRDYYWDGLAFAINIENVAPLRATLHPNHLVYTWIGLWLYRATLAAGVHIRALFLLQGVNSLLAGAAVVLVYRALLRRSLPKQSAIAAALLFGFAASWWKFATDVNAYIPSIFLVLCANHWIEEKRSPLGAGLAHAAAMLFHELAILYLPVVWFRRREWNQRIQYTLAALIPVVVAYVAAYRAVFGELGLPGLCRWAVSYTPDAGFSFQPLRDLMLTLSGTLRLFAGGKLSQIVPGAVTVLGILFFLTAAGALVLNLRRIRWTSPPADLVVWLVPYLVFLFFWMPQNTFYRLFYLPPLVLILGRWVLRVSPLVAAALFLWNAVFFIYPKSRVESNAPLSFALAQHQRWPPGTPIVFHRFHPDLWTISYFNQQASWIGLDRPDFKVLERGLAQARAERQPLWLEGTAYDLLWSDSEGRQWIERHHDPSASLAWNDNTHGFRFYAVR